MAEPSVDKEGLVAEKQKLDHDLDELRQFLEGEGSRYLVGDLRIELTLQHDVMKVYSSILGLRIGRF